MSSSILANVISRNVSAGAKVVNSRRKMRSWGGVLRWRCIYVRDFVWVAGFGMLNGMEDRVFMCGGAHASSKTSYKSNISDLRIIIDVI